MKKQNENNNNDLETLPLFAWLLSSLLGLLLGIHLGKYLIHFLPVS